MVRVCHASDWHWNFQELPEADLYVFTGDMLPNHPVIDRDKGSYSYRSWTVDAEHERLHQGRDIRELVAAGGVRRFLGSPDAPVIAVRGNHDFVDIEPLFEGCAFMHEFLDNESIDACGLRVTGHRGIPYINGRWSDEVQRPELVDRMRQIPFDVDLVLTHYAPEGILDKAGHHLGLEGMASALGQRLRPGGVHCFGHIHECGGQVLELGDLRFSNAATTFNCFDVEAK